MSRRRGEISVVKTIYPLWLTLFAVCLGCDEGGRETERSPAQVAPQRSSAGKGDSGSDGVRSGAPLQALYITSYENIWHDYERQQQELIDGVSRFINIEFDLVGKDNRDSLQLLERPEFALGYDVVLYNMCFADDFDLERIDNIISQTRELGVPAVLLHCAMHSFQQTSPRYPEHQLELASAEYEWRERHPNTEFPYWWRFTGVDTLSHDWARSVSAKRSSATHPLTKMLPEVLEIDHDELYRSLQVLEGVTPLYSAFSPESEREHLVAWTHTVGAGRVFATTLGHDHRATQHPAYQQLIAHGVAFVTGTLDESGWPRPELQGTTPTDNYQATVTCQPSDVVYATSVEQAQTQVARAYEESRPLKVISVPKSNSNSGLICPEQGGLLLNMSAMNKVLELNVEEGLVRVQPGVKATELSQYLHERGFAIPMMPDYTGVSVAGALATGAHHSSLRRSSNMADMLRSMTIIDGTGALRRFEGDELDAVAVHLGMLGVIVELTLAVEPQFKLQYGAEQGSDEGLEERIVELVKAHDYGRVMWFAGNQRYVLDYYDRVSAETPGRSRHNLWTSSGSVFRVVGDLPYRVLNRAPLRVQCDSAQLRSRVWLPPIQSIDSSEDPVGWSHEMLGSACEPGTCPWDFDAVRSRTMEASFPLRYLDAWMADVRAILRERRACFPILGIYLRFSKGGHRWLGFNYSEDVVSFEIHIPKVANETYQERSADVYDELMQMTLSQYQGRPHWGKNSTPTFVGLGERQYPRWADFIELKRSLDPAGLFENKLWRQMSGEEPVRSYPGCSLSRDCVCSTDSDCGARYKCEQGGVFTQARVCRER